MPYKVIITTTYMVEAKHPLLAAKAVRDNKAAVSDQDLYVFGERGGLEFRENGSVRPYPDSMNAFTKEQLDEAMKEWAEDEAL